MNRFFQPALYRILAGVCLLFMLAGPGLTAESKLAIKRIRLGLAGQYKVGRWVEAVATVQVNEPCTAQMVVIAPDPHGHLAVFPSKKRKLDQGEQELSGLFRCGRLDSAIRVEMHIDGKPVANRTLAADRKTNHVYRQSALVIGKVGEPAGFDFPNSNESVEIPLTVEQLPDVARGYESLDVLVFSGDFQFDSKEHRRRARALEIWVKRGGQLIISVGRAVEGYRESDFASWVPIDVVGQSRLRQFSGLESFAGHSTRIVTGNSRGVEVAIIEPEANPENQVLATEQGRPLIVRTPVGFGRVTVVAFDMDTPPFTEWRPIDDVGRKLIGVAAPGGESQGSAASEQLGSSGITDLASQWHATQEEFPQVRRWSSWMVMGLIFAYFVVVGPLDYVLVHFILKKPNITWITFPLMVGGALLLGTWGAQATNGEKMRINQIDVIDVDVSSQTIRGSSWMTVYSPGTQRYRLAAKPTTESFSSPEASVDCRMSWVGLPEEGFGGMYRSGGVELGRPAYAFAPDAQAIENLPISIWSTRTVSAEWESTSQPLIDANLTSTSRGQLSGTIQHDLPAPIQDWIVAYGNRVYFPADSSRATIAPQQSWSPNLPGVTHRDLGGFLTGTVQVRTLTESGQHTNIRIEKTPYNPLGRDRERILRMITFHHRAGGPQYTGLSHDSLSRFELTGTLELGRAVLVGRVDQRFMRLAIQSEPSESAMTPEPDEHTAFVRFILPVRRTESGRGPLRKLDSARIDTESTDAASTE